MEILFPVLFPVLGSPEMFHKIVQLDMQPFAFSEGDWGLVGARIFCRMGYDLATVGHEQRNILGRPPFPWALVFGRMVAAFAMHSDVANLPRPTRSDLKRMLMALFLTL